MDLQYKDETGSTNDDVKALAQEGSPHGTVIYTFNQKNGRGRFSRPWQTRPNEGLAMSVLLRGKLPPTGGITLGAAVAICRYLRSLGVEPKIKWPNDVLLGYKKVCGISAESVFGGESSFTVVGIGVNLNTREFPDELRDKATSLWLLTDRDSDMHQAARVIASCFLEIVRDSAENMNGLIEEYSALCVNLGREAVAVGKNKEIRGIAEGIDDDGGLMIRTSDGLERVISGEVSLRTPNGYI